MGSLTTVMALVAQALGGTAISIVLTINGSLAGPVLGAFTLGLFFPWVNFKVNATIVHSICLYNRLSMLHRSSYTVV